MQNLALEFWPNYLPGPALIGGIHFLVISASEYSRKHKGEWFGEVNEDLDAMKVIRELIVPYIVHSPVQSCLRDSVCQPILVNWGFLENTWKV